MKRLTTPLHEFTFDIDPRNWTKYRITYNQGNKTVLEKKETDTHTVTVNEDGTYKLSYQLTQEETKKFYPNLTCQIQIRSVYANGDALASDIVSMEIEDVLNCDILGGAS